MKDKKCKHNNLKDCPECIFNNIKNLVLSKRLRTKEKALKLEEKNYNDKFRR